jgi:hypothetical protein
MKERVLNVNISRATRSSNGLSAAASTLVMVINLGRLEGARGAN